MNNLLTLSEPLGQCDSNFIGMFQTVRFIQMMSSTFGLFTQVGGSGPLGPLVFFFFFFFSEMSQSNNKIPVKITDYFQDIDPWHLEIQI